VWQAPFADKPARSVTTTRTMRCRSRRSGWSCHSSLTCRGRFGLFRRAGDEEHGKH
jgi:hypothetical protein